MNPVASSDVLRRIEACGALLRGHFRLSSGLHSDQYVQCARLFQDPAYAEELGRMLAALAPAKADLVVSPALGGLLIGHETAKALGRPFLFTERADGAMALRRGFEVAPGQTFLVVEDVLTTGKSTREVLEAVRALGAVPVGALSVIDRGLSPDALGVPFASLVRLELRTFQPDDCALCREGLPLVKPGSRPDPKTKG